MKKLKLMFAAIVAVVLSVSVSSCSNKNSEIIDEMVNTYNSPSVQNQLLSSGIFEEVKAQRSGNDIVINMTFSVPGLDLGVLNKDDQEEIKDEISSQFASGLKMSAGKDADKVIDAMKEIGADYILKMKDKKGNTMEVTIPVDDL